METTQYYNNLLIKVNEIYEKKTNSKHFLKKHQSILNYVNNLSPKKQNTIKIYFTMAEKIHKEYNLFYDIHTTFIYKIMIVKNDILKHYFKNEFCLYDFDLLYKYYINDYEKYINNQRTELLKEFEFMEVDELIKYNKQSRYNKIFNYHYDEFITHAKYNYNTNYFYYCYKNEFFIYDAIKILLNDIDIFLTIFKDTIKQIYINKLDQPQNIHKLYITLLNNFDINKYYKLFDYDTYFNANLIINLYIYYVYLIIVYISKHHKLNKYYRFINSSFNPLNIINLYYTFIYNNVNYIDIKTQNILNNLKQQYNITTIKGSCLICLDEDTLNIYCKSKKHYIGCLKCIDLMIKDKTDIYINCCICNIKINLYKNNGELKDQLIKNTNKKIFNKSREQDPFIKIYNMVKSCYDNYYINYFETDKDPKQHIFKLVINDGYEYDIYKNMFNENNELLKITIENYERNITALNERQKKEYGIYLNVIDLDRIITEYLKRIEYTTDEKLKRFIITEATLYIKKLIQTYDNYLNGGILKTIFKKYIKKCLDYLTDDTKYIYTDNNINYDYDILNLYNYQYSTTDPTIFITNNIDLIYIIYECNISIFINHLSLNSIIRDTLTTNNIKKMYMEFLEAYRDSNIYYNMDFVLRDINIKIKNQREENERRRRILNMSYEELNNQPHLTQQQDNNTIFL